MLLPTRSAQTAHLAKDLRCIVLVRSTDGVCNRERLLWRKVELWNALGHVRAAVDIRNAVAKVVAAAAAPSGGRGVSTTTKECCHVLLHVIPTKSVSVARAGVREDCGSRGTADSPTSVEVLHDESAITFRPSVDIGCVACAVVVPEIGPPDIVALACTYRSRAQPAARQGTQPAASAQQILDPPARSRDHPARPVHRETAARSQRVSALHAPCA